MGVDKNEGNNPFGILIGLLQSGPYTGSFFPNAYPEMFVKLPVSVPVENTSKFCFDYKNTAGKPLS